MALFWSTVISAQTDPETLQSVTARGNGTTTSVGIGTTSPAARLHVANGDLLLQNTTAAGYPMLWLKNTAGDHRMRLDYNSILSEGDNLYLGSPNGYNLVLNHTSNGNVGIGTEFPTSKLDIAGVLQTRNLETLNAYWDNLQLWSDGANSYIQSNGDENGLRIKSNGGGKILFESKVGIGTENVTDNNFNLFVEKGIRTRKQKVDQASLADYVFDASYQLQPLNQVETYIRENKHLPEMPSAVEVKKDGIDVGENQALLLRKIEELTLYIIQQQKEIQQQNKEMMKMKARLKILEAK